MHVRDTYHAGQTALCRPHSPGRPEAQSGSYVGSRADVEAERRQPPGHQDQPLAATHF